MGSRPLTQPRAARKAPPAGTFPVQGSVRGRGSRPDSGYGPLLRYLFGLGLFHEVEPDPVLRAAKRHRGLGRGGCVFTVQIVQ